MNDVDIREAGRMRETAIMFIAERLLSANCRAGIGCHSLLGIQKGRRVKDIFEN